MIEEGILAQSARKRIPATLRWGVLLATLPFAACEAMVGVANNVSIPRNAASVCAGHCQSIGMRLSAVAIMANNIGCVCQDASQPNPTAGAAGRLGTPAAGMSTIAAQEAAAAMIQQQEIQRQQQQQQQQQQRRQ